jgi:hypothetical protein
MRVVHCELTPEIWARPFVLLKPFMCQTAAAVEVDIIGASTGPPRYMDSLIRNLVRTMLLHCAGVWLWYPIHNSSPSAKPIVAGRRQGDAGGRIKKEEDLRQAGMLFEGLQQAGTLLSRG